MAKLRNPFENLTPARIFTFIVVALILVQIVSLLISSIFKEIPIIKGGPIVIIISAGLTIIFLTKIVFSGEFTKMKIFGLFLLIGITVLVYMFGSNYFPTIFSFIDSSALESAKALQSALNLP